MDCSLADLICLYLYENSASEFDEPRSGETPPAAPADIAAGIGIDPSDIRGRLDVFETLTELVSAGDLSESVEPTAEGHERNCYELTDSGRDRIRELRRDRQSDSDAITNGVTPRETISGDDSQFEPPPSVPSSGHRDSRRPDDRFVGREADLEALHAALSSIRRRGGRTLFVTGDRGVGKSTLCARLVTRARERDFAVGRARCRRDTDEPYGPLRRAIDDAFDASVPAPLSSPSAEDVDDGASLAARRSALLGEVAETVCARATDRPTLLFVDDLHWADASTLALFERIATQCAAWVYPLLLVGSYRPRAVDDAAPLATMRARLSATDQVAELSVEPFDRHETAQFVRQQGGPAVSDRIVDRVHETAGGNPLVVSETLAGLAESAVAGDASATQTELGDASEPIELPVGPEQAIKRRLEPLDDAGWRVIEAAAVVGQTSAPDVLQSIVSLPNPDVEEYVRLLVDARILDRTADGAMLSFPSGVIRETVIGSLSAERRRTLHARAADALVEGDAPPATIAHHCAEAGELARAIDHYERAARLARRRYAGEAALDLYERALDFATRIDSSRRIAAIQLELGETRFVRGEYDEAAEHFAAVRDHTTDATVASRARHRLAEIQVKRGDVEAGIATVTDGLAQVTDAVPAADRCRLHRVLGWGRLQNGDLDGARDAFERHADVAGAVADPTLRALADHDLGTLAGMTGDVEGAEERLSAAVSTFERLEDWNHCAKSLTNLALVNRRGGHLGAALETNERALAIQREYGYQETLPDALLNQAELHRARGDLALATESYEAAIDAAMDIGREERAAKSRTNLAQVLTQRGRLDLGAMRCQEAIDTFERLEATDGLAHAYTTRSYINEILGEHEVARADAEHGLALARDLGNDERIAAARDMLGRVARSTGDVADALAHHTAAASLAREGGNDIAAIRYRIEGIADHLAAPPSESAREQASDARTVADETDEGVLAARALTRYGRACRRCGDHDAAERAFDGALETQTDLGLVVDRCETLLSRCALELDSDRPAAAADSLDVANALIQEYGLACHADWAERLRRRTE